MTAPLADSPAIPPTPSNLAPPRTAASPATSPSPSTHAAGANFLRHIVEHDLARGAYAARLGIPHRATTPVDRAVMADPARLRTRFPPEPNGYLHIGHAKSICLNFGLARDYDGVCHLRFDDTNPEKEEAEYVDAIIEMVRWLGFDWDARPFERELESLQGCRVEDHLYFASEYFELLYEFAEYLIRTGHAYVDSQSAEAIRASRGSLVEAGRDSPHRERGVDENLALFRMMRAGDFEDGAHVLRARIDMASPNINLRDPVLYRIRHAHHHRTGDAWCIYPMYDYTHCVSDALENITHSICTLEFEDHRPLYDWALERIVPVLRAPQFVHAIDRVRSLREQGVEAQKQFAIHCHNFRHKLFSSGEETRMRALFDRWEHNRDDVLKDLDAFFDLLLGSPEQFAPLLTHALDTSALGNGDGGGFGAPNPFGLPHQYEFSRLNLTYVVTSKRKLKQLVDEGHVDGWDDPRMPTLVGLRRRGYTPESIRLLCDRGGVSKSNSWTDYGDLEQALRDDLDPKAARAVAVLDPVRLVIDNFPEDLEEPCTAPVHPHAPERGQRSFPISRALWIERDDFQETPQKGFFRLYPPIGDKPGSTVRLKYGYTVRCTGFTRDSDGVLQEVRCDYLPETRSGTPGADTIKVKGNITWISVAHAQPAEFRLYDRLFSEAQPDAAGRDFLEALNPASRRIVQAYVEPGVVSEAGAAFQFERLGYFVADRVDSTVEHPVFNRSATLRDHWQR